MRTRSSNKTKRFVLEEYSSEPSDSEKDDSPKANGIGSGNGTTQESPVLVGNLGTRHSYRGAGDDGAGGGDEFANENAGKDDEDVISPDEYCEPEDGPDNIEEGGGDIGQDVDANRIQQVAYVKVPMRAYDGPLKNAGNTAVALDYMYGPDEGRKGTAAQLYSRFFLQDTRPFHNLGVDDDRGPTISPWVPAGFERSQAHRLRAWLTRYEGDDHVARQQWRVMDTNEIKHFIFEDGGSLALMHGPYKKQEETIFSRGNFEGVAFTESGLKAQGDRNEPTNWVINTGGLILSVAWAPREGRESPMLAACVVPHSDQQPRARTVAGATSRAQKAEGVVQFWMFPCRKLDSHNMGTQRPSDAPPTLVRTLCFSFGRAKRAKWCPIAPTGPRDSAARNLGLLAILFGDGIVRVVDVGPPQPGERLTFSECLCRVGVLLGHCWVTDVGIQNLFHSPWSLSRLKERTGLKRRLCLGSTLIGSSSGTQTEALLSGPFTLWRFSPGTPFILPISSTSPLDTRLDRTLWHLSHSPAIPH